MPTEVIATPYFIKEAKPLIKKYVSLKSDLTEFTQSLMENPIQGNMLLPNIYKVRLAVKSKGKGRSGGLRVITHIEVILIADREMKESLTKVRLITIYDKSDYDTVDNGVLVEIIQEILEEEQNTDNE